MQTELIVYLSDLRYVEIHCPHCSTKVTLDMENPPQPSAHRLTAAETAVQVVEFVPTACPGCREVYDTAIRPSVTYFQRAYHSLLAIPKSVTFRGASSRVVDEKT